LAEGEIDTLVVRDFHTTPAYYDYHWIVRPDIDETASEGMTDRIVAAILALDPADPDQKALLDLFLTDSFIETRNENYEAIREIAATLGILR
jgi:phosphonate transport system substrate-binding protein